MYFNYNNKDLFELYVEKKFSWIDPLHNASFTILECCKFVNNR